MAIAAHPVIKLELTEPQVRALTIVATRALEGSAEVVQVGALRRAVAELSGKLAEFHYMPPGDRAGGRGATPYVEKRERVTTPSTRLQVAGPVTRKRGRR